MENKTFFSGEGGCGGGATMISLSTDPKGSENTRIYEIKAL